MFAEPGVTQEPAGFPSTADQEFFSENDVPSAMSEPPGDVPDSCVCTMAAVQVPQKQSTAWTQPNVRRKPQVYSHEVEAWAAYINGNGKKPKMGAPTLISTTRTEKAANKPLVLGTIEGRPARIFFDTGAEVNVIDDSVVQKLQDAGVPLKIEHAATMIRCANDTRMRGLGQVTLNVEVGGCHMRQTFIVVKGMFPRAIVGIRQMKRNDVLVDPGQDCLWIGGNKVPFVSRVQPEKVPENARPLIPRA